MHRAVWQARHGAHRQLTPTQPAAGEASGAMLSRWWPGSAAWLSGGLWCGLQEQLCVQVVEVKGPFGRLVACMWLAVVSCSWLHAHTGRACSGTCTSGVALARFSTHLGQQQSLAPSVCGTRPVGLWCIVHWRPGGDFAGCRVGSYHLSCSCITLGAAQQQVSLEGPRRGVGAVIGCGVLLWLAEDGVQRHSSGVVALSVALVQF